MIPKPSALRWLCVAGLAACEHTQPFRPDDYPPGVPNGSGSLIRLTYNPGQDLAPSWLPDGSGFLYTMERDDREDRDRCLARMPARGGSITALICDRVPAADDSVDTYSAAAVAPDGRMAYFRTSASLSLGRPLTPDYEELVLGSLLHPEDVRVLQSLPTLGPSGRVQDALAQLAWLGDSSLVYVAQKVFYIDPCRGCPPDTLPSGLEIARLDFGGPTPRLTMLPGSDQASSLAMSSADTVYYTINGDSRVFRLVLSADSIAVVHDFGATLIARDVRVVGNRMVAVVGGNVSFGVDPGAGPIQRDGGGQLLAVDLQTGTEVPLAPPELLFRHPALAPDGRHVVA